MFKNILIANRGEIAIRIIQAARELGIESVAVYHKIDKEMPFVSIADYAYEIKGDTPKAAYLDIQQIINTAKMAGAEAIHPGYGFLSENAEFSKACQLAGIKFIGPFAESITAMGSKTGARNLMTKAGVPTVPGVNHKFDNDKDLLEAAHQIGYPVILKAAAGGGGKGMKLVWEDKDLVESYSSAKREAIKSFGDDLVYMEKYIVNPKHIEMQIIADEHGNCVWIGERDCSIQRRHQKVIEEAPSTVLDANLRKQMGEVAVAAAKACNYVNAGTIEFLLDKDKKFYFLEMNTRLQVEHPVTELVSGIDLAKEQIKIAYGMPLSFNQEDIKIQGHAIEVRIYAEDAQSGFLPDTGSIQFLRNPSGPGIRIDGGIESGTEIGIHFDPMLSKLITFGKDRNEAANRMVAALKQYKILGFKTIIPFLIQVIEHPKFRNEWFDTGFIEREFDMNGLEELRKENIEDLSAIVAFLVNEKENSSIIHDNKPAPNKWKHNSQYIRKILI